MPLERTEFVRSDQNYSILNRLVRATQVDTIVHTVPRDQLDHHAEPGPTRDQRHRHPQPAGRGRRGRLVRAPGGGEVLDPRLRGVRERPRLVPRGGHPKRARSGPGWSDPSSRSRRWCGTSPRTTPTSIVTVLRFANVLGTDIITPISYDLRRRLLPCIAGYDPLVQFIEEDDVVRALEYVTGNRLPGVYNVAGAGKLPWSEVASIGGAFLLPLPPFRPRAFVAPLQRIGRIQFPPEMEGLVRYGRGVDTTRLVEAGFEYRYTSAGAVESFARANNLRRATGSGEPAYRYEQDVEQFFPTLPCRGPGNRRVGALVDPQSRRGTTFLSVQMFTP